MPSLAVSLNTRRMEAITAFGLSSLLLVSLDWVLDQLATDDTHQHPVRTLTATLYLIDAE